MYIRNIKLITEALQGIIEIKMKLLKELLFGKKKVFNKSMFKTDEFTGYSREIIFVNSIPRIVQIIGFNVNHGDLGMSIDFNNERCLYFKNKNVSFVIDGEKMSPSVDRYQSWCGERCIERITLRNNREIKQIMMADTEVEFNICNDRFEIPIGPLRILREVLN